MSRRISLQRILVRGPNWVGDAVMAIPALRHVRRVFPEAHVTLLLRPPLVGLFRGAEFVDALLPMDLRSGRDLWEGVRRLRAHRYDAALLLTNSFGSALVVFAAGIPVRLGYATDGRAWLLTHRIPRVRVRQHQVYTYLRLVVEMDRRLRGTSAHDPEDRVGGSGVVSPDPIPRLRVSEERRREALALLDAHGVDVTKKIVVLNPGAVNSRAKQWVPERFAAVGDALLERGDTAVVLIGTPGERETAEIVRRQMMHPPSVLTGHTSVDQMVAIVGCASLVISNDTGAAHVASAVGTPTIVLFGPTDEEVTRPFSDRVLVIRKPVACAPCLRRDCPIDHRCMTEITVADVLRPAMSLLERGEHALSSWGVSCTPSDFVGIPWSPRGEE